MTVINSLKKIFCAHGYLLLIIAIFVAGATLRLYNFENRLIFGPEQGMSLITSASNLEKFSLLGETNWIRATSAGHTPFHGALYSYMILPLLVIFNFRVLPVTIIFALLNLMTAFIFFRIANKPVGKLKNHLVHKNYETISEFIEKINSYSDLAVKQKNVFPNWWFLRDFFKRYFYKLGFLDGYRGLFLSYLQSAYYLTLSVKNKTKNKQ